MILCEHFIAGVVWAICTISIEARCRQISVYSDPSGTSGRKGGRSTSSCRA